MSTDGPSRIKDSAERSGQSSGQSEPEILFGRQTKGRSPEEVLRCGMIESCRNEETALYEVLPGVGKSLQMRNIANWLPVSMFKNVRENYEQFDDYEGIEGPVVPFPVATDLCDVLGDDSTTGGKEDQAAREAYENDWSVSLLHRSFDLSCQRDGEPCPYIERLREIDPDGLDPLVGHHSQAYNRQYVDGRVVVLDEDCFDTFWDDDGIENPIQKARRFIDTLDDFPFNEVRRPEAGEEEKKSAALEALREAGLEREDHSDSVGEFHAKAPLVAYAIYGAERMDNGLYVAELPGDRTAAFTNLFGGVAEDDDRPMWIFDPPDFSGAEAVIALDATPCVSKWKRVLGDDLKHYRLFDDEQRNRYLREEGYDFRQLHDHIWSVSGGDVSIPKCEAYLREIYRKHGERPDLVSSKKLIEGGENWKGEYIEGLEDHNLTHLWNDALYYGDLRSKDNFGESDLLVVLGSPGRSDLHYQFQASFHGECAIPATDDEGERLSGHELDYQNEVANDILDSTRKGGVFQAAMRAGRRENTEATIYIATGMVPDWLDVTRVGQRRPRGSFDACLSTRSEGEKQVIEALRGAKEMSASEIIEQVEIGPEMVKNHRQKLQEKGLIEKEGERRWARYSDTGLEHINIAGEVDLSLSGNMPYKDYSRGSYPIESRRDSITSPREPKRIGPTERYPDWMRSALRWARERRMTELEDDFYRRYRS